MNCYEPFANKGLTLSFNHGEASDVLGEQPLTVRGVASEGVQAEASRALVTAG